jgi:hypothetical protein
MGQQVYKALFEVMKNRRGPYTGVEVPDLIRIFAPPVRPVSNAVHRKPWSWATMICRQ